MIRVIGKVYPFKDKSIHFGTYGLWLIKKVIKLDKNGHPITQHLGAMFEQEKDAVEYCQWWNRKYFNEGEKKDE